jgi:hypothetical protein
MAMLHKAYAFDWIAFKSGLLRKLTTALRTDDPTSLLRFIAENRKQIKDPYEGDPLSDDWQEAYDAHDVQTIADFALTRYYDPAADYGIDYEWGRIAEERPDIAYTLLLGKPVGPRSNRFDPGRYGSYFQRPGELPATLENLSIIREPALRSFRALLRSSSRRGLGVYVTF